MKVSRSQVVATLSGAFGALFLAALVVAYVFGVGKYHEGQDIHAKALTVSNFMMSETPITITLPDGKQRQATVQEILATLVQERVNAIAKEQANKSTTAPPKQ